MEVWSVEAGDPKGREAAGGVHLHLSQEKGTASTTTEPLTWFLFIFFFFLKIDFHFITKVAGKKGCIKNTIRYFILFTLDRQNSRFQDNFLSSENSISDVV